MKLYFSDEQKTNYINNIELEDLTLYAEYIEGEGSEFQAVGKAIIDNETFNDFVVEFKLEQEPENMTIEDILQSEWEYYDYKFD